MNKETVVLITGCSTGIGRQLSRVLTDEGYTVIATARNVNSIKDLQTALKLPLDVTDRLSVASAVSEAINRFQKIDILINNAGYSLRGALEEVDLQNSKELFDVNVFGIINLIQAVVPEMRKNKCGRIINIGSISGKFTQPINGVYCASKHAVEALTDALRLELNDFDIETTVIEPGPIETDFFKTLDRTSSELLCNPYSCYSHHYKSDINYRTTQKRTSVDQSTAEIAKIIAGKKLKSRYKIAVPLAFRLIIHLPDYLKESIMRKH